MGAPGTAEPAGTMTRGGPADPAPRPTPHPARATEARCRGVALACAAAAAGVALLALLGRAVSAEALSSFGSPFPMAPSTAVGQLLVPAALWLCVRGPS